MSALRIQVTKGTRVVTASIPKPFTTDELLRAINTIFDIYQESGTLDESVKVEEIDAED